MTGDHDEVLGKLSEELAEAMAAGETIDHKEWARRFQVGEDAVRQCQRGLAAVVTTMGEELAEGHPELPQPELPGDFEVIGELGRGGMGVVYRARQRSLDREVAIKVLRPGDLVFGDALRRFRAEARSLARLRHRHIVSVYDSGETPEGLVWFAMDLVDGRTLADELQRRGRMLPARATKIIRQVTSAIAHAHAQGIVHRDLKPQNVLIDGNGDAFVVDFGLARDASAAGSRTMSGELLGTPAYMSPEQASGDAGSIGEGSDVWALGALLYEMLVGRGPFSGMPLHETIRAILHDPPPAMRRGDKRVPEDLERICQHALQKLPEDRYAGALAFGEDVERFQDGRGVLAQKPSKVRQVVRALQRHWRAVATVAAAVTVTLFAVTAWLPTIRRDAIISEARRMTDAGHPAAAIESLRSVMVDVGASDYATLELDLVRARNDRVGELLLADDEAGAIRIADEVVPIARRRTHTQGGIILPENWDYEQAMRWELARSASVTRVENGLTLVDPARLIADLESGLPGRMALARRVASESDVDLSRLDEAVQIEILCDGLRAHARRITSAAEDVSVAHGRWGTDVDGSWSPAIEDALADLATNVTESDITRALAFRAWSMLVGLPTFSSLRASGTESQSATSATVEQAVATAPVAIEHWRRWRTLSREDACKARIDLLALAMARPGEVLPLGSSTVVAFAQAWTGHATTGAASIDAAEFQEWWQSARNRPYAELLFDGLGHAGQEQVTLVEALDRSAVAPAAKGPRWRQLAWLQVPDGARIPEYAPEHSQSGTAWRTACLLAAGQTDTRQLTARAVVLRFEDSSCIPEVVAQRHQSVRIGQIVELPIQAQVVEPTWLSFRRRWEDEAGWLQSYRSARLPSVVSAMPAPGQLVAAVQGQVQLDRTGVRIDCSRPQSLNASLPSPGARHTTGVVRQVWLGTAGACDGSTFGWGGGGRISTFLLLVALQEGVDGDEPALDWWRAAAAKAFEDAVTHGGPRLDNVDWWTASLWPMPTALDAIRELGSASRPADPAVRIATMLAGGPSRVRGPWPIDHYQPAARIGVRLLSADAHESARREALTVLSELPASEWTPRLGQQLREMAPSLGAALPPTLVDRLASLPTPGGIRDWISRDRMGNPLAILALIGVVIWWCVKGSPERRRKVAASLAMLLFLGMHVRIQIDGWLLTPSFLLVGLIAVCIAMSGAGRKWWRITSLTIVGLLAVWAAASWWFAVRPPQGLDGVLVVAALVGFVPPHRRASRVAKK